MPKPDMTQRAALYRLFDSKGRLLYVGISLNPEARWNQHRGDKGWWPKVADKQVTWYGTRMLALQAEALAIRTEQPIHNTVKPHQIGVIPAQLTQTAELSESELRIRAVAEKRARAKAAYDEADKELRAALIDGRAAGDGPSEMARWSGFTREWVAKIAPEPKPPADA